jgi:hypothetical protein
MAVILPSLFVFLLSVKQVKSITVLNERPSAWVSLSILGRSTAVRIAKVIKRGIDSKNFAWK